MKKGTVLAIDWGERRLGVAVGELELRLAHPLCTLHPVSKGQDLDLLHPLIDEWRPVLVVVGVPGAGDAAPHPLAGRCKAFARRLQTRFSLPVHLVDESYSSAEADTLLKHTGKGWKARKQHLDPIAAQQILEGFFERHAA